MHLGNLLANGVCKQNCGALDIASIYHAIGMYGSLVAAR